MLKLIAKFAFTVSAIAATSLVSGEQQFGSETTSASAPSIILIVADDMDYADLSLTGGTKTPTPNIDSIAKNGVQFTQAYVTCPVCGPSRVAILSGRYQDRIGYVNNHGPVIPENFGLPTSEVLIPEMLKGVGYKTGMIGKWHLGFKPDMVPNTQGFDYFFGHLHGAHDYRPGVQKPGPILRNAEAVKTTQWLTTAFGDEAAGFIRKNSGSPYFLYVPFNAVHSPLQASPELLNKFSHIKNQRDRTMAAMLHEMDQSVGKILQAVAEAQGQRNTLIAFFNDNGGTRGELPEANGLLRGGKSTLYEGGIRVPLLMQWTGTLPGGVKYEKPVISTDLVPTFLAAAQTTASTSLDGINLLPYLSGENKEAPHRDLFWRFVDAPDQKAMRKDNLKIVMPAPGKPWQLYDLAADPGETKDLAPAMPEEVSQMQAEWNAWNTKNKEPLFLDSRLAKRRAALARRASNTTETANSPDDLIEPAEE